MHHRLLLLSLLLWSSLAGLASANEGFSKNPEKPLWVIPEPDGWVQAVSGSSNLGASHLLVDRQYHQPTRTAYAHFGTAISSLGDVQHNSSITLYFEESKDVVVLHILRIHRDGETLDRLADQQVQILREEAHRNSGIYTGELSAHIILDDVRIGDVIEYAYSQTNRSPAIEDQYGGSFSMGWSSPVKNARAVVMREPGQPLYFATHQVPDAEVRLVEGLEVHEWYLAEAPAIRPEDRLPAGYNPYPFIEFSSSPSWKELSSKISELYDLEQPLPAEIEAEVERIKRYRPQSAQVTEALRFVQDNLRYVSLSLGDHGYKPYPIVEVWRRRFGDCKDMSLLFASMLNRLGIEATPVLVSVGSKDMVGQLLPRLAAFDHVIVRIEPEQLHAAALYIDPTSTYARGDTKEFYLPNYGWGLPITPDGRELEQVPGQGKREAKTHVYERLWVASDGSGHLSVETRYHGVDANKARWDLDGVDLDDVSLRYQNFYDSNFPGLEVSEPLVVKDDESRNVLHIVESYRIPKVWQGATDAEPGYLEVSADMVASRLVAPSNRIRQHPLALAYPERTLHSIEIGFEESQDYHFEDESKEIRNPAFRFGYLARWNQGTLYLEYSYESLADQVPPDRISDYLAKLNDASNLTAYRIQAPGAPLPEGPTWTLIMAFCGTIAGFGGGLAYIMRKSWCPPENQLLDPDRHPVGLGGWLILPCIGLIVGVFYRLIFFGDLITLMEGAAWSSLTSSESLNYNPLWAPLLIGETIFETSLFLLICAGLVLFFMRKRLFPKIAISLYLLAVVSLGFDAAMCARLPDVFSPEEIRAAYSGAGRSVVAACIWIPYMLVSKRVRNTFVR